MYSSNYIQLVEVSFKNILVYISSFKNVLLVNQHRWKYPTCLIRFFDKPVFRLGGTSWSLLAKLSVIFVFSLTTSVSLLLTLFSLLTGMSSSLLSSMILFLLFFRFDLTGESCSALLVELLDNLKNKILNS